MTWSTGNSRPQHLTNYESPTSPNTQREKDACSHALFSTFSHAKQSLSISTTGHARYSNGRLPQGCSKSRYAHSNKPVLQGPIELSQFTAWAFTTNVAAYGIRLSLGTVGDCFDNAMIEAFWGRMQTELLNCRKWTTIVELSVAMADYIENFHNTTRRHSALDILTPTEYETINTTLLQLT